jgi:MFS family permease
MLAGLFLGLAPSIIRGIFHINSGLVNGTLVALLPAAGTIASLVFGRVDARKAVRIGAALVIVGIATIAIGVSAGWFAFLFLGAIIGGTGIGASFSGTLRTLAPLANPSARAELFAAIYLVSYLAYGAPALVAGEFIGLVGLLTTVIGYGGVAMLAAALSLLAQRQVTR